MTRTTSPIEATIIDYLHRNGGEGTRQALIDGMALLTDYTPAYVREALANLTNDGLLIKDGGVLAIDYDASAGE